MGGWSTIWVNCTLRCVSTQRKAAQLQQEEYQAGEWRMVCFALVWFSEPPFSPLVCVALVRPSNISATERNFSSPASSDRVFTDIAYIMRHLVADTDADQIQ